jgi:acetyl esterase/lipase
MSHVFEMAGEDLLVLTRSLALVVLLAFGNVDPAFGDIGRNACTRPEVEKREHPGVWEPGPEGKQIPLWPDGHAIQPPETEGNPEWVGNGSPLVAGRYWNWATYVSRPTMTIYRPKGKNTGAAMLVLPGGGYAAVAMDLEGTEICDWITEHGVTCVVLKYRTPQTWRRGKNGVREAPKVLLPLEDAQRAIALLRLGASSYGIDPGKIGAIGFSAGGHLAAELSNAETRTYKAIDAADSESSLPNFAILLYPGRLWDTDSPKQVMDLAPWIKVSAKAPPTLMIHAMNDPVDDVRHSMAYGLALNDAGVPVDMRLYAGGCHAFGLRPTSDPVTTEWPGQVVEWLHDIGVF